MKKGYAPFEASDMVLRALKTCLNDGRPYFTGLPRFARNDRFPQIKLRSNLVIRYKKEMHVETDRLILRSWEISDVPHLFTMSKDMGYNAFAVPGFYAVRDEEEAREKIKERIELYQNEKLGKFLVFLKSTGEFIGTCGIDPIVLDGELYREMGYRLCLAHWGNGYGSEAARAAFEYGFKDLKLPKMLMFAVTQNRASLRIIEKLGFQYLRNFIYLGNSNRLYELKNPYL